jgi:hypothetical protein
MNKFHCPKCKQNLRCGCKACIKNNGKQDGQMIMKGDIESCPNCGFTLSCDQWMDIEYDQLIQPKFNNQE